jgi:hypothetical protein
VELLLLWRFYFQYNLQSFQELLWSSSIFSIISVRISSCELLLSSSISFSIISVRVSLVELFLKERSCLQCSVRVSLSFLEGEVLFAV